MVGTRVNRLKPYLQVFSHILEVFQVCKTKKWMFYPIYVNGSTCFPTKILGKKESSASILPKVVMIAVPWISRKYFLEHENDDLQKKGRKKAANCVFFQFQLGN